MTEPTPQPPQPTRADQDQRQRLVDLEASRRRLIHDYHVQFDTLQRQIRALQPAITASPAPSPTTQLPPPPRLRPHLPPHESRSPDTVVPQAPAISNRHLALLSWIVSAVLVTWSVVTPQYVLSVIPDIPLYPIFLTFSVGLLLFLVTAWRRAPHVYPATGVVSMLYALAVGGPFLVTWLLCARVGFATWPAALAGLLGPSLLLLHTYRHGGRAVHRRDGGLYTMLADRGSRLLTMLVSVFYGYGCTLLGVFAVTVLTPQRFGPIVVANVGLLLLIGTALSGGLLGALQRSTASQRLPASERVASGAL